MKLKNGLSKIILIVTALAILGVSSFAFAQNMTNATATPTTQSSSATPTKNDSLSKLEKAIKATPTIQPGEAPKPGHLDPSAAPGFLGIPGAPNIPLYLAFLWAVWVGWIFSTVGAFGGVMASVGHMAIFGFGAYASSFKTTSPALNKVITDSIRVSNQCLVGTSAAFSSFNYWRMGRVVVPLALALGAGSIFGSWLVPTLTAGKISFKEYSGYFGLFVLFLGCYLFWETTPAGQATKKKAKAATEAFEKMSKACTQSGESVMTGVKINSISLAKVNFNFCGVDFSFNPVLIALGGFVIASMASFLGVGGGFLLVPFLTSVTQLPMYLAAGTSALAVLIGMITSISTFLTAGTPIDWNLIGVELVGIIIGSYVGPKTSKYLSDKWMKRIFIVLALYVGIKYTTEGLFGIKILP
ncbi:TSUP family transporter [Desulfovibrio litoralis]|uniref:Probable membrane transporter protein n=1 Tax=Desulfovibrio litoralis DSM 11393 TaxID=1121455 RepID=A0A1M7SN49_9BACT|nr:TSUP family transporter [Desulfovibrio litoralis]SHN59897.1 hypothetical protein SAMN02745728_01064 [Desulfovibrio litoralis DSM 11393]